MVGSLSDCLVPYKHYASEVISGVLDEIITPDDTADEDYPCETTMLRWKHWLMANYLRIDGYLKSIGYRLLELGERILSKKLPENYLKIVEQTIQLKIEVPNRSVEQIIFILEQEN